MTSIQKWLADVLDDALPDRFVVRPYPWAPDGTEPDTDYVAVVRTVTEPAPNAQGARRHELNVVLISSHTDADKADEALDAGLDAVLDVLDHDKDLTGLTWTRAERGVLAETYPAITINTWCISTGH